MSEPVSRLAVFDLDGTLTWHDTFARFMAGYVRARPQRLLRLWRVLPALLGYLTRGHDRGLLKQRIIQIFMRGDARSPVDTWAKVFADQTLRSECRGEALAVLREHQRAGDFLVLLSASPDLYVPAIGRQLGVDRVICTQVAFEGGRLAGNLLSPNRRGEEKLRCIEALRREFPGATIHAYGNSNSDLDHLQAVEHPLLVNANAEARQQARRLNIPTAVWN